MEKGRKRVKGGKDIENDELSALTHTYGSNKNLYCFAKRRQGRKAANGKEVKNQPQFRG
jgi:hypothetical protein